MESIILEPSPKPGALVKAIENASKLNQTLLLAPGIHFTTPGVNQRIAIGANGLQIGAAPGESFPPSPKTAAIIMRPDFPIDPARPDSNYGLYFVPAPPIPDEIAAAQWKSHTDDHGPFEFDVVIRGSIDMTGLGVDCNMGKQHLEDLPKDAAEHSAMFSFSGQKYPTPAGPSGVRRFIYVGFDRVSLKKMMFQNGGFADDVWFSRGYFHPNIEQVILQDIASKNRVNPRRATISFSGLSQSIQIKNAKIYSLHLEELSAPWSELPRRDSVFKPSMWSLSNIEAQLIGLAAKGHVFKVRGVDITVSEQFGIYEADGTISNSKLRVTSERRLFRLQTMVFDQVTWYLPANANGIVAGLQPTAQYGDPCFVEFRNNTFVVEGAFSSGQLIDSEYSRTVPKNHVRVICGGCSYPASFATKNFPDTHIIQAMERGTWLFETADFGDRDLAQAVVKGPQADVVVNFV